MDGLKKAHANHVSDQTARDAHHATLAERLDYLERHCLASGWRVPCSLMLM